MQLFQSVLLMCISNSNSATSGIHLTTKLFEQRLLLITNYGHGYFGFWL